jgi:prepilin-type processing-associated H-X9-DG protein
LLVIGILALLIALLLPSLARARAKANEAACLAKLHQIGIAAQLHVSEHHGYLPAAGWQFDPIGGVLNPQGLADLATQKYMYYSDAGIQRPVPITVALGAYLAVPFDTSSRESLERDMLDLPMRKRFSCPSQQEPLRGLSQRDGGLSAWTAPPDQSSYIFNEALLGRRPGTELPQIVGHITQVTRTSETLLAMDGRPRNMTHDNWIMVFNQHPDDTLFDFVQETMKPTNGFGKQTLDYYRHEGRANVLFADGHAQSVLLDEGGLKSISLSAGLR